MKLQIKDVISKRIAGDNRRWRRRQRQFAKRRALQNDIAGMKHFLTSAKKIKI
ncbi:TPA: hypothetical protein ACPY7G_003060 [Morganella morganii]|uniref:hypothetical protein n=1 Tax=Morganella morganii TaxID=582 RepID=UPI0016482295|nr:hypothetical protein [Morganella morganii]MBC3974743.1 hypothetical protein [Morganella morganii]